MTGRRALLVLLATGAAAVLGGGLAAGSAAEARQVVRPAGVAAAAASGVDPRSGGFEVALGEWALAPEARAIRPGRVTFVIRNRGKLRHGLELALRAEDDGGHGGDDAGKAESIELNPGQVTRMTLDLAPGVYELECSVGDHDDRGMRGVLEVRADAPLVSPPAAPSKTTVRIASFAFKPATIRTTVGKTVTWRNDDAAPHTATAKQFSSPQLGKGGSYRRRFTRPGTYTYVCALHPGMRGRVIVAAAGG